MTSYFAPAFKVEVDAAELKLELARHVISVSVVNEPDTFDQFTLTLANPYPALPWTHDTNGNVFAEGARVKISMGYVDALQQMFDGEITSVSPTFPESGTPTVTISGYTLLHRLQGSAKTRTFVKQTDKQIAQQIASDLSLTLDSDPTPDKNEYVIQYNQTDLAFLKERARRIGFEVAVDGEKLHFRAAKTAAAKSHTLAWGNLKNASAPSDGALPLQSFTPTMSTLRQVAGVVVRGRAPKTRKTIEGKAPDPAGPKSKKKSGADIAAAAGRRVETVVVDSPIQSQAEADRIAKAIYESRLLQFITGSGSTIGIPDLRAGGIVELQGLGKRFSGTYLVTQATHTISSGGYLTSFAVRKKEVDA